MNLARLSICLAVSLVICLVGLGCDPVEHRRDSGSTIQQVGLVWLKQAGDPTARQKVIDAVHEFGRSIPDIESATVGETDGVGGPYSDTSFDVCFILTFTDEDARQRYGKHPVHEKAAKEVFLPLSKKLLFYRFVSVRGLMTRPTRPGVDPQAQRSARAGMVSKGTLSRSPVKTARSKLTTQPPPP